MAIKMKLPPHRAAPRRSVKRIGGGGPAHLVERIGQAYSEYRGRLNAHQDDGVEGRRAASSERALPRCFLILTMGVRPSVV